MRYRVRLLSAAHYETAAPIGRHVLRVAPRANAAQHVQRFNIDIEPKPRELSQGTDFFGNATVRFTLDEPHEHFIFRAESEVTVTPPEAPAISPAWEEVRAAAIASASLAPDSPAHFLFASRIVELNDPMTGYAAESFTPGRPILHAAREFAARIHRDFVFDADATDVNSAPSVAFSARHGVCQDFAHIMIAGLRGLGLPAAYASGYLRTLPPPGQPPLEGADATHAWVHVWCGAAIGWVGIDPTNDMLAGADHILIGVGRDYADIAPEIGVIVTHGKQSLDIAVDVTPLA